MSKGLGMTQTQKFGRVVSPVVCAELRLLRMLAQLAIGAEGAIGFEGLALAELGQFVEEQHAAMGERDFAGARPPSAPPTRPA